MKQDLKNLKKIMDESVYKEEKFTHQHKQTVLMKSRRGKGRNAWIPRSLTAVFVVGFLGLGANLVTEGFTSPDISPPAAVATDDSERAGDQPKEASGFLGISNLPTETPLELTPEFKANVSIPLDLKEILPSIKSKPFLTATTLEEGFRIYATYTLEENTLELIESVETPEKVAKELTSHVKMAEDEQKINIKGHFAFYSEEQKEMHIFTNERYFTVYGAEKDLLLEVANLIDFDQSLTPMDFTKLQLPELTVVDLSEIEETNYIGDLHKNIQFLQGNTQASPLAAKGPEVSSIRNHYASPLTGYDITVEQMYDASGKHKIAEQIIASQDIVRTVETADKTILLMTNGRNYSGYFVEGNYAFLVIGGKDSIGLENVEEILKGINLE
jgi:hypothetical protein